MPVNFFRVLSEITMDIYDLMELLGIILRAIGAATFGLGVGWVATQTLKGKGWQLSVATVLGLLAAFVFIGRWIPSPGTLGGFGLGVGAALLFWGVGRSDSGEED